MENYENEIIVNEETEILDEQIVADSGDGLATGVAMAIGAGIALAVTAGVKFAKKCYHDWKAKKEADQQVRKPDKEIEVTDAQVAEVVESN